jgi:hypothetical protein
MDGKIERRAWVRNEYSILIPQPFGHPQCLRFIYSRFLHNSKTSASGNLSGRIFRPPDPARNMGESHHILQENIGNRWNMKAIFQLEYWFHVLAISGVFLLDPARLSWPELLTMNTLKSDGAIFNENTSL